VTEEQVAVSASTICNQAGQCESGRAAWEAWEMGRFTKYVCEHTAFDPAKQSAVMAKDIAAGRVPDAKIEMCGECWGKYEAATAVQQRTRKNRYACAHAQLDDPLDTEILSIDRIRKGNLPSTTRLCKACSTEYKRAITGVLAPNK